MLFSLLLYMSYLSSSLIIFRDYIRNLSLIYSCIFCSPISLWNPGLDILPLCPYKKCGFRRVPSCTVHVSLELKMLTLVHTDAISNYLSFGLCSLSLFFFCLTVGNLSLTFQATNFVQLNHPHLGQTLAIIAGSGRPSVLTWVFTSHINFTHSHLVREVLPWPFA